MMANGNDSRIITYMMSLPPELMVEYFVMNHRMIIDDAMYWNVLGTLWKMGGTVVQQELWKGLFQSNRKKRHKIMKKRERKRWRRLPETIVAYRAINNESEIDSAISWTLSMTIANEFSEDGKRKVVEKTFSKKDVFAFFDRRREEEILVNLAI